jgi:hypothetical protein
MGPTALGISTPERLFLLGCGLVLVVGVVLQARGWRKDEVFLALTPAGLTSSVVGGMTHVPWTAIAQLGPTESHGQRYLGIDVRASQRVQRSGAAVAMRALERAVGHDVAVHLGYFGVPPETIISLAEHYHRTPLARGQLTESVEAALRRRPDEDYGATPVSN